MTMTLLYRRSLTTPIHTPSRPTSTCTYPHTHVRLISQTCIHSSTALPAPSPPPPPPPPRFSHDHLICLDHHTFHNLRVIYPPYCCCVQSFLTACCYVSVSAHVMYSLHQTCEAVQMCMFCVTYYIKPVYGAGHDRAGLAVSHVYTGQLCDSIVLLKLAS